jgi:hypothetical protein
MLETIPARLNLRKYNWEDGRQDMYLIVHTVEDSERFILIFSKAKWLGRNRQSMRFAAGFSLASKR